MRRLAITLLCACPVAATADRAHEAIERLPELGEVEHGRAHVVVRGELSKSAQRDALKMVGQVIADVERRFTHAADQAAKQTDRPITLALLPSDKRYLAVATQIDDDPGSMWGFYRPDLRIAIANWGASIGNLRHELVHPLIGDDYPEIPAWLNEGIASLYGTAKPTDHGFEFLVNYRLRDLQTAIRRDELPTIAELANSTDFDVRGPHAATYYAMARYVLLFAERAGKLGALYAELRDTSRDHHGAILARYVDDAAFVAWAKKLHW